MGWLSKNEPQKEKEYVKKTHFSSFYRWIHDFLHYLHEEMRLSREWATHLHEKTRQLEENHAKHIDETKKTIVHTKAWIDYLHQKTEKSTKEIEKTKEMLLTIYEQHKETIKIIDEIKQENIRLKRMLAEHLKKDMTPSVTEGVTNSVTLTQKPVTSTKIIEIRGEEKEEKQEINVSHKMTQSDTMTEKNQEKESIFEDKVYINIEKINKKQSTGKGPREEQPSEWGAIGSLKNLNITEKRVLYLLLHEQKPISYQTIAEKLEMNYSTVKNTIYRLRKQQIPILDYLNKQGEKEFYLPQNLKIALKNKQ
ncbi:MAG: HTH domain-containing protein [Candidatus Woesearchaeota archaeon]